MVPSQRTCELPLRDRMKRRKLSRVIRQMGCQMKARTGVSGSIASEHDTAAAKGDAFRLGTSES